MKDLLSKKLLLLLCLFCAATATGQGAPAQIDTALLDLGARLGQTISLSNLSDWRWEQKNFADSALGCATASGSGGAILGYEFRLTYSAVTYDYRVSADNSIVVYCGVLDTSTASAAPESAYSNRLCADAATGGPYMRSNIIYGIDAEVVQGFLNLRGQPAASGAVIMQIPAGLTFEISSGPDCADGYVWWLANVSGQIGYVAEAGGETRFIQPERPVALPSREILNRDLIAWLQELTRLEGNFRAQHSWSSDGVYIALPGGRGSDSIWLYDLRQPSLTPRLLAYEQGITAIAFRPNHQQVAFGSGAGSLHLWQFEAGETLTPSELLFLNAHGGAISALGFAPQGNRLASAGPVAYTHVDVDRNNAALIWDLPTVAQQAVLSGHRDLIRSLAFSPDGAVMITGAEDGTVRFWDADSGATLSAQDYGAPITAVAYSREGETLAIGLARASDNLLILDDILRPQLASYRLPTAGLTSLGFSPDGSMLVAGAAEGIFSIWDTASRQLILTRETGSAVRDVSFSPDGSLIAVSTDDHALSFYGVPLGSG